MPELDFVAAGKTNREYGPLKVVAQANRLSGRALGSAGLDAGGLDAVLLVGGSSRIPLIAQLVSAELGRPVAVDADPKTTTATGAALAARGTEVEETAVQDEPVVAAMPMSSAAVDQDDVAVTALPARPPKATLRSRDEDEDSRPEHSRVRMLALAAAASVVAMIALAGTVGSGINPLGSTGGTGTGVAAAGAAPLSTDAAMPASGDGVDQWTGRPRAATTTPGPQRPNARAAVTPPGARTTSPTTNARPAPDGGGGTGATTPRPLVDSGGPSGPGNRCRRRHGHRWGNGHRWRNRHWWGNGHRWRNRHW